jgi:16S rRNA (uracil1498-N3)-methyltransferase
MLHRFFISHECLHGEQVLLAGRQAHQIRNVLRMTADGRIIVLDNAGWEYEVRLDEVGPDRVTGTIIEKRPATGEPGVRVTLYQSLLRQNKFRLVLQKCTEIGVAHFVPIVTKRSLVHQARKIEKDKLLHWQRIIAEAAEQSHRGRLPRIDGPIEFKDAVSTLDAFDLSLIATAYGQGQSLRSVLQEAGKKSVSVALLIGPEGGFTEEEVAAACNKGATPVCLGRRVLRTETAAVVGTCLILYELGQLDAG